MKYCGLIHTLWSLPDHGGDVCKVWFRSVQKCGFVYGTNIHSSLYIRLAGVPSVAYDEKLRKQIFEITWRDEGWIG